MVGWCDGSGKLTVPVSQFILPPGQVAPWGASQPWTGCPPPGRFTIWMIVGQGPIALAVGAGGGCLDIFSLVYLFSFLSPSLGDGPI